MDVKRLVETSATEPACLHNAGNDAAYTMVALILVLLRNVHVTHLPTAVNAQMIVDMVKDPGRSRPVAALREMALAAKSKKST